MGFMKLLPTAAQIFSFVKYREKGLHIPSSTVTDTSRVQCLDETSQGCLQDVLRARAESLPAKHLLFYPLGGTSSPPKQVTHKELYDEAKQNSLRIATLVNFRPGSPVLVHFEHHWDTILWVWAVMLAGGVPVLSSPLSNVEEHRENHLQALSQLLKSPICITREASLHLFAGSNHTFDLYSVESLLRAPPSTIHGSKEATGINGDSLAMLMLTSGSSGNAKAVRLSHRQILAAVSGKASVRPLPSDGAFLNWIGLDHVASLVEIHIQALWLGVDQVHVHPADVVASPPLFLDLLSKHRVSRSFAPNFFLAKLVTACDSLDKPPSHHWDLSHLTVLASGGEANDIQTCAAASSLFAKHGASPTVITPGFGMTETCAGAIFNTDCPQADLKDARSIASVGRCMPGIEMRITDSATGKAVEPCQTGHLEIRGPVVFKGYYRNSAATTEAFTSDGWFRTGDEGGIDAKGNLSLIGRVKDVININGVKIVTADMQASLEAALKNTCALRVVSFPSRAPSAATEQITIAYIPNKWPIDAEGVIEIDRLAAQACSLVTTACRPVIFGVGSESLLLLPLTTLGKISGAKMRALFEAGVFEEDVIHHRKVMDEFRRQKEASWTGERLNETETLLRAEIADIKGMTHVEEVGIETNFFEFGFTSMDVIRLKHRLDTRLGITVATIVLMKHPTVRSLAGVLDKQKAVPPDDAPFDALPAASGPEDTDKDGGEDIDSAGRLVVTETEYDAVVVLRSSGTKTPLWLVHPGVGDVLVFVGLAQHMSADDRPIYALRARGFEPGQSRFADINEAVTTYAAAVRQKQPHGPYAIAGYSYGTMLAFEMAKRLGADGSGEAVGFLGSFNLPPHIKMRMRQLSWNMCLLHLTQFLGLGTAAFADEESVAPSDSSYRRATRSEALVWILKAVEASRMRDLGLGARELARWADVAHGLQSMAVDYEPSGLVPSIDVFHAEPLKVAAPSREAWVTEHLGRWNDFSRSEPRFHEVGGAHYTMIGPEYVASFSDKLRAALNSRGI
ncbi:acetyl-CoA synthetase-like protein [Hypoxylon sp. NC1633]|nr:acetyl-CoA synthetase-like protein [Hypoxylon sp. NC1633]